MYMCVCTGMCVFVSVSIHVCMEVRGQSRMLFLSFEIGSLTGPELIRPGWLTKSPRNPIVSVSPDLELQTCAPVPGFNVDSAYRTQFNMLT